MRTTPDFPFLTGGSTASKKYQSGFDLVFPCSFDIVFTGGARSFLGAKYFSPVVSILLPVNFKQDSIKLSLPVDVQPEY